MSLEAPTGPEGKREASNTASSVDPTPPLSPVVSPPTPPQTDPTGPEPIERVALNEKSEVIKQETHVETATKVNTPTTAKKDKNKLVLATWQSDEGVSECYMCKRSFNPLLLRFKVRISQSLPIEHLKCIVNRCPFPNLILPFNCSLTPSLTLIFALESLSNLWTYLLWQLHKANGCESAGRSNGDSDLSPLP